MAVPVGQNVYVTLASGDVIHAWYVPRFLFKRDVVPGQANHFEFTVDTRTRPARRSTASAPSCAEPAIDTMLFDVVAMTQADYDAWLAQADREGQRHPAARAVGRPRAGAHRQEHRLRQDGARGAARTRPFAIDFTNDDIASITHDVDIHGTAMERPSSRTRTPIPGGETAHYTYEPLAAGHLHVLLLGPSRRARHAGTLTVK